MKYDPIVGSCLAELGDLSMTAVQRAIRALARGGATAADCERAVDDVMEQYTRSRDAALDLADIAHADDE